MSEPHQNSYTELLHRMEKSIPELEHSNIMKVSSMVQELFEEQQLLETKGKKLMRFESLLNDIFLRTFNEAGNIQHSDREILKLLELLFEEVQELRTRVNELEHENSL